MIKVFKWRLLVLIILSKMGRTKAAVFPVPVCAHAIKSLPDCITGIASCCIGVGCLIPWIVIHQLM